MAIDASVGWYEDVFATHAIGFRAANGIWSAFRPAPAFHSALITLQPEITADQVRERITDLAWGGPKDSFASIDGHVLGMRLLFEATWIHRPAEAGASSDAWTVVTDAGSLAGWNRHAATEGVILPALLERSGIFVLERREGGRPVAGAVLRADATAIDLSNVHAVVGTTIGWLAPGRPIVGFERDDDLTAALDAGWEAVAARTVWAPSP